MTGCVGCTCEHASELGAGSRVLFSTQVSHSVTALRSALTRLGAAPTSRGSGLLEVLTNDPTALIAEVRQRFSIVEAKEIRVLVAGDEYGDELVAAAFAAPTLDQAGARCTNADLQSLFADEAASFHSVYQPIVDLARAERDSVVGYEALLRANGPGGPISPDRMFAAAAQAGWLHVLDRVGRTTAMLGAAGWLADDLLFVNFIPTTIYRPEVCLRTTEQAAATAGLRLGQLVFEVTESEEIGDIEHLSDIFAYYRERGAKVALDDLGAGYSSLNTVVRLKPDVVKLDKEIVQGLPDPLSRAVVRAVVDITHSYGGLVLAECIETEQQSDAARELDVDLGQGWFFGKPEPRGIVA